MKKSFLFFATILLAFTCLTANAQTSTTKTDSTNKTEIQQKSAGKFGGVNGGVNALQDGMMMANGKMVMIKDGQATMMDQEMTLSNGTIVMQDGTVKMSDGTTMLMQNGDHMSLDGNLVHNMDNTGINTTGGKSKMKSNSEKMKVEGHHKESKDKYK